MSQELKERCIVALICVGCGIAILLTILFLTLASERIDNPTECEWEREIIKEATMYPNWDTTQLPVWMKYYVMCKDTGVIKTYKGF